MCDKLSTPSPKIVKFMTKQVCQEKTSSFKKQHSSPAQVCKAASVQTRLLEQCLLVRWDQSGDFSQHRIWIKPKAAYHHLTPTVKHGGRGVMIWICVAVRPGYLAVMELIVKSSVYQSILHLGSVVMQSIITQYNMSCVID